VEAGGCLSTYLMAWDVSLFGDRWGVIWCCVCSVLRCVAWYCSGQGREICRQSGIWHIKVMHMVIDGGVAHR
jgi:hypothetical protein